MKRQAAFLRHVNCEIAFSRLKMMNHDSCRGKGGGMSSPLYHPYKRGGSNFLLNDTLLTNKKQELTNFNT